MAIDDHGRLDSFSHRFGTLVRAIEENDDTAIADAITNLSRRRRIFAPLALMVSGLVLLFEAVRLLVSNWRLVAVQFFPAVWIWLALFDLKLHVLHGESFTVVRGPVLIPIGLVIVAITVGCFFLDAVFAFAIAQSTRPNVAEGVSVARRHMLPIAASGSVIGLLLAFSTTIVTRWGHPWFGLSLGITVGLMMICYIAVPARLIGMSRKPASKREKLSAAIVGGALSATVATPPYVFGRIGMLMLGSRILRLPGLLLLAIGLLFELGATGAVRAIKTSTTLVAGRSVGDAESAGVRPEHPDHASGTATAHGTRVAPVDTLGGDGIRADAPE